MSDTPTILTAEQMKGSYGSFYESSQRVRLDPNNVPKRFWPLIPYAEFWGIADDLAREILIDEAPKNVQQNLKDVVAVFDSAMDEWLAGPDADNPNPTDEYIAFSAMRMAAYYA